ncbi:MAG: hypothetical protein ACLP59_03920 [Bryobacteraceae bacterium]
MSPENANQLAVFDRIAEFSTPCGHELSEWQSIEEGAALHRACSAHMAGQEAA